MRLSWFDKAELVVLGIATTFCVVMFIIAAFMQIHTSMVTFGVLMMLLGLSYRMSYLEAVVKVHGLKLTAEDFMRPSKDKY